MASFAIVTDSNADILPEFVKEKEIIEVQLSYSMDGKSYLCNDPALSRSEFYKAMRVGSMPKTAAVNVSQATEEFRSLLECGFDILCIAFSSALSATYQSFFVAAQELKEQFPERRIVVIDTLCASAGEALVVSRAVTYRDTGCTLDEAAQRVREDSAKIAHLITVDDLFHLHRGGRVSKTTAIVGSIMGIKPTLRVNEEGRIVPLGKVRGRKQALLALVDEMEKMYDPEKCDTVYLSHGDCLEDVEFVVGEIEKRFGIKEHVISYIGPTVGAHSGPSTVALFFYAKHR